MKWYRSSVSRQPCPTNISPAGSHRPFLQTQSPLHQPLPWSWRREKFNEIQMTNRGSARNPNLSDTWQPTNRGKIELLCSWEFGNWGEWRNYLRTSCTALGSMLATTHWWGDLSCLSHNIINGLEVPCSVKAPVVQNIIYCHYIIVSYLVVFEQQKRQEKKKKKKRSKAEVAEPYTATDNARPSLWGLSTRQCGGSSSPAFCCLWNIYISETAQISSETQKVLPIVNDFIGVSKTKVVFVVNVKC